jgi:hypothetical protein
VTNTYFDTMQSEMEQTLAQALRDRRINIGQEANYLRDFVTAKRDNDLGRAFDVALRVRLRYSKETA